MIGTADAQYILQEIRNIAYYEKCIGRCMAKLTELDNAIANATAPVSPNSGTDVKINGKVVRVKIHGGGTVTESKVAAYVSAQEPIERDLQDFRRRQAKAKRYLQELRACDEKEFVMAVASGMSYREMSKKYYITNPYDKIIRLIIRYVRSV